MYEELVRPALFALFQKDAEDSHIWTMRTLEWVQKHPRLLEKIRRYYAADVNEKPVTIAGVKFPNRLGLAAGMDKQAHALLVWQAMGFGFVEVGSVLPRPQAGNDRPRMFRIPELNALYNRMGFNSDGVAVVSERLAKVRPQICIPIGGSLGKQKETELDEAADDYCEVLDQLADHVDYYAANVSSPNTPGLRKLQGADYLEDLVSRMTGLERDLARRERRAEKPLFLKLAPDLDLNELEVSIGAAEHGGAAGLIIGNTTVHQPLGFRPEDYSHMPEGGGFSGAHQFARTLLLIRLARRLTKLPIIACGGIFNGTSAKWILDEGADLVQVLTGLVYRGPKLVREIREVLALQPG